MASTRLYHARKVQGVCPQCGILPPRPLGVLCAGCASSMAERKARWAAANPERVRATTQRHRDRPRLAPGPNQVACCGVWHAVPYIPWVLECCGKVLALVEEPAHA